MPVRHFHLPFQILLWRKHHGWIPRADAETAFTPKLGPVGFRKGRSGQEK